MSSRSEKSLLAIMALALSLIIVWLIASDSSHATLETHGTNLVGTDANPTNKSY